MRLYSDIILIILTIGLLYLFYQHICGYYRDRMEDLANLEHFTDIPGINAEAVQALSSVVDQNYLTMPYMIVMYKGGSDMVPTGWALCDGENGTPDLRDKFVACAGPSKALNSTGGGQNRLTVDNLPPHVHTVKGQTEAAGNHSHSHKCASDDGGGSDGHYAMGDSKDSRSCKMDSAGRHTHAIYLKSENTGAGRPFNAEPQYYALSFIMKLPPNT